MATITWSGHLSSDWFLAPNWVGNIVPTAADSVAIGVDDIVDIAGSAAAAANISLAGGASLDLSSSLALSGTLSGALVLAGTLSGGTLETAPIAAGGTLDGVTLGFVPAGLGGIAIDPATAGIAQQTIDVLGTLTLTSGFYPTGSLVLDPSLAGGGVAELAGGAGTVTLGPAMFVSIAESAVVQSTPLPALAVGLSGALLNEGTIGGSFGYAADAAVTIGGASFVNRGAVTLTPVTMKQIDNSGPVNHQPVTYEAAYGPTLDITAADFNNDGAMGVSGGTLLLSGATVDNQNTIALTDAPTQYADGSAGTLGTRLVVAASVASFANTGKISADVVEFDGAVGLSALGAITGQLDIAGTLDLNGGTLDASQYGTVYVTGTVRNGTLLAGSGSLDIIGAKFDGATVDTGSGPKVYPPNTLEGIPPGATQVTLDAATVKLEFAGSALVTGVSITAGGAGITDTLAVDAGAVTLDAASSLTLLGGTLDLNGPGSVANDGTIAVQAGTLALGAALVGTGSLSIAAGAVVTAATLGGNAITLGTGAVLTAALLDAGAVTVGPNATLTVGTLGGDAVLTLEAGASATIDALSGTPTVEFAGTAAFLVLPGTGAIGVTLAGMQAGDLVDFTGVSDTPPPNAPAATSGAVQAGGSLDVTGQSGDGARVAFLDPASYLDFSVTLANGGSLVTAMACFRAGTRILTARGQMRVERLHEGDLVRTASGRWRKMVWLGSQAIDCRAHARPQDVWPVRIAAHAFAPGRPSRDLFLSPDHAVKIGGALIPVRYLLNGASIAQVPAERVTYWHVELPAHDVLLAENLPVESFLDTGNRGAFTGAAPLADAAALRIWRVCGHAPLLTRGPIVAAAHARLLARARHLGHALTEAPDLRVTADGRPVPAEDGGFRLPPGAQSIRLRSRSFVPAELAGNGHDPRRLGVAVAALRLDGAALRLDDARLAAGWHRPEPGWRWTGGDAIVAAEGARHLSLDLAITGRYWTDCDEPPQRLTA